MNIPLDDLYRWIQGLSPYMLVMYFSPHGSKTLNHLTDVPDLVHKPYTDLSRLVHVIAHDQEPLDWHSNQIANQDIPALLGAKFPWNLIDPKEKFWQWANKLNLDLITIGNNFDQVVLLHSEQNSKDLAQYAASGRFVTAYWWSHAVIARDWFRFAEHDQKLKFSLEDFQFDFNIYVRAWSGTREYRLKFLEKLQINELIPACRISFQHHDSEHYIDYHAEDTRFAVATLIDVAPSVSDATLSATYSTEHYALCAFDIVTETIFSDCRHHLTEKVLRAIACGKPFVLLSTPGSLQYLRQYGFKTFAPWIDESYDNILDPIQRMDRVLSWMKQYSQLAHHDKAQILDNCYEVAKFNKKHFFSRQFFDMVTGELKINLLSAVDKVRQDAKRGLYCTVPFRLIGKPHRRNFYQELGITTDSRRNQLLGIRKSRQR